MKDVKFFLLIILIFVLILSLFNNSNENYTNNFQNYIGTNENNQKYICNIKNRPTYLKPNPTDPNRFIIIEREIDQNACFPRCPSCPPSNQNIINYQQEEIGYDAIDYSEQQQTIDEDIPDQTDCVNTARNCGQANTSQRCKGAYCPYEDLKGKCTWCGNECVNKSVGCGDASPPPSDDNDDDVDVDVDVDDDKGEKCPASCTFSSPGKAVSCKNKWAEPCKGSGCCFPKKISQGWKCAGAGHDSNDRCKGPSWDTKEGQNKRCEWVANNNWYCTSGQKTCIQNPTSSQLENNPDLKKFTYSQCRI